MSAISSNNRKYVNLSDEAIKNVETYASLNKNSEFNTKLCEIVDTFSAMLKFCQRELYQMFSESEIKLLCNTFSNRMYTPNINPKTFFKDVTSENIMFNNVLNEFSVDENSFMEKVDKLTSFQCYFLMHQISIYHCNDDEVQEEEWFDKCFSILIKK